ncbi:MAG: hypothetical protein IJ153_03210 [Clostridia bacterium]|nr:hypothetical protein [Clostridia bacterium]
MLADKSKKRSTIFLAFVLILATGYYFIVSQGSPSFRFSAEKRVFGFYGSKHTSAVFSLDTLEELRLYEGTESDYGRPVEGGRLWGGYHYGTWENESLGVYEAYVSERFPTYMIARDGEKTAIFNAENAETTQAIYRQLHQFWIENQ